MADCKKTCYKRTEIPVCSFEYRKLLKSVKDKQTEIEASEAKLLCLKKQLEELSPTKLISKKTFNNTRGYKRYFYSK